MRRRRLGLRLGLALSLAVPTISGAAVNEIPVGGKVLKLRTSQTNPSRRRMVFRSGVDAAIVTPFADPATGASLLVHASNATGQCHAEVDLPAGNWSAIRGDGPNNGWRYRDPAGSNGGVFKVVLKRRRGGGVVVVKAKGSGFPCGLEAGAQQLPISVVLHVGDDRYCATFGGSVLANAAGVFKAKDAAAPASCPDADLTVVDLNVLHGLFCPGPTGNCRLQDRLALLGQWIAARGCPDAVALQEVHDVNPSLTMIPLIQATLPNVCDPPYEVLFIRDNGFDDSLILSRYPALESEIFKLYFDFRNVLHVRLDHPIGPVDLFSTHLASGSDSGSSPCGTGQPCPQECIDASAATIRDCQALQLGLFVEAAHDVDAPAIVMGDFNRQPGSFVYHQMADRGWPDTYLIAGNPECAPATGVGCTSGREDQNLTELESPALNVDSRIDYIFLVPPGPGSTCAAVLDLASDNDADGTATRLFAADPNPFSGTCGPSPDPMCWVSDHSGVEVDVNCE